MNDNSDFPANQFLGPELVMTEMADVGGQRAANRSPVEVLVLSTIAGAFHRRRPVQHPDRHRTTNEGTQRLLEGFGFDLRSIPGRVAQLWILAAVACATLSGVLGNWLVGMAAFLDAMGRTIIGKYIPVLLMVSAFVASGFVALPFWALNNRHRARRSGHA